MKEMTVRTRFAPSPTGYMHVGNLRTALYAYLLAKHDGGTFILRIEDTDQERQVEGAVEKIYTTLRETGLLWDEGPDIGGAYGPYIQSERMGIYEQYAETLIQRGGAYYCFCGKEELEAQREAQKEAGATVGRYDGTCRDLSPDEVKARLGAGVPYVIRQRMPREGTTSFDDVVYGRITVPNDELEDQVLIKADKMPTYNFANVVDDHLMNVTHVIRGSEYLSSAPKYNLLYEAFGWELPVYVHCPPVMRDQSNKLSKRHGDASYEDLIAQGYLTDAVLNYIALLGWSPGGEEEIFSLRQLTELFSLEGLSKSPAIFDLQKLRHINASYIRALPPEEFMRLATPYIRETAKRGDLNLALLCSTLQPRCELLSDIPPQVDFIDRLPAYDTELYVNKKMKTTRETSLTMLGEIRPVLQSLGDFSPEGLHTALFQLIARLEVKNGAVLWPLRVALSGKALTPGGGIEIAALLGKDESLARLETGIALLQSEVGV